MREILFRGKRIDNGELIEGHLIVFPKTKRTKIMVWEQADLDFNAIEVNPETVGQYTGLTDKNGKKIFEGDIVDIIPENEEVGIIEWADDEAMFMLNSDGWCANFDNYYSSDVEVIGNIHDNPELLEVPHE